MTLPPSDDVESELEREFGGEASISPLSTPDGIGRRLDGIEGLKTIAEPADHDRDQMLHVGIPFQPTERLYPHALRLTHP